MRADSLQLTMSVSRYRGAPSERPIAKTFAQTGGTIGRLAKNDLVLPDPSRIISGCHARIRYEDDGFFLDDVSTNGVFVNDAETPVGKGNSVRLAHGDVLVMGEYELRVDIAATEPTGEPLAPPAPQPEAPHLVEPFAEPGPPPRPAEVAVGSPPEPARVPASDLGIPEDLDPLALLDDGLRMRPLPPPAPGARSDHLPAEQFHFEPPRAVSEEIPADWEQSGLRKRPEPARPVPPARGAAEEAPVPAQGEAVVPSAGGRTPPGPAAAVGEAGASGLQAFLLAAGMPPARLERPADELLQEAGLVLRAAVAGLMDLLAERSAFKQEFRVERTMIGPVENNPLKFARSPEDALRHLLVPSGGAFLRGEDAVRRGVQDMKDHRVAILAAMRTAFEALLSRFDPERLEADFEAKGKRTTVMRLGGKSRAWEQYCEFYAELQQDPDRLFREVLGEVFSRAYEEQVARLARERG